MANLPLVIRAEQMRVFEDEMMRRWLADYLRSSYPKQTEAMGPAALEEFVAGGLRASHARFLRDGAAIRKYVHVMFLLGPGLETDPEFAWARKILNNSQFRSDLSRLRVLEDEAIRFLSKKETAGARP